mmetsp:Transcript_78227/g.209147  ORF Transcript_78227/g.209147 Transcript_78227/m.209147 type:complete len:503 (-) Transcript_78227:82-1590(-)
MPFNMNDLLDLGSIGFGRCEGVSAVKRNGELMVLKVTAEEEARGEIRALQELQGSPWIVRLHDTAYLGPNRRGLLLELVSGGTLRQHMRKAGSQGLSPGTIKFYVAEMFAAVEAMHERQWMHRDLKPENVMLDMEGHVKLIDFDNAVPMSSRPTDATGTVEYMAPEVYDRSYNQLADVWSLGVITYELLLGYKPFNDVTIDGVQELVREYKSNLIIPSNSMASDADDFLGRCLCDWQTRIPARSARAHPWLADLPRDLRRASAPLSPLPCPVAEAGNQPVPAWATLTNHGAAARAERGGGGSVSMPMLSPPDLRQCQVPSAPVRSSLSAMPSSPGPVARALGSEWFSGMDAISNWIGTSSSFAPSTLAPPVTIRPTAEQPVDFDTSRSRSPSGPSVHDELHFLRDKQNQASELIRKMQHQYISLSHSSSAEVIPPTRSAARPAHAAVTAAAPHTLRAGAGVRRASPMTYEVAKEHRELSPMAHLAKMRRRSQMLLAGIMAGS